MKHLRFARSLVVAALIAAAGLTAGNADDLKMSNKWRIEVGERAKFDGVIVLRVTPDGGQAIDVSVPVPAGFARGDAGPQDVRSRGGRR